MMAPTAATDAKRPASPSAFTLIELLVVVTIIVVLLALLVPALDRAIYSAELATCMARLKGIHGAVSVYATQHQRAYPHRPGAAYLKSIPHWISRRNPDLDDRVILAPYMSLNQLLCPLDGDGVIDLAPEASASDTGIAANYELWFQWPITASGQSGARVMRRLGDRWRWNDEDYSVIAGDWNGELGDVSSGNNHYAVSSHPDRLDRLVFHWGQNKVIPFNGLLPDAGIARGTSSLWEGWNPGGFDLNYGYDDGSVQQINNAVFPIDERFEYVAMYANNTAPARQNRVPKN